MLRFPWAGLALLAACATMSPAGDRVAAEPYLLATYSVQGPQGSDWGVWRIDPEAEVIEFGRMLTAHPAEIVVQATLIRVLKVPIPSEGILEPEDALAAAHLREAQERVSREGKNGPQRFWLDHVWVGKGRVAEKELHGLRYELSYSWWQDEEQCTHSGLVCGGGLLRPSGSVAIYLYFPPDWQTRRAFYSFSIEETWQTGNMVASPDLSAIRPVVTSFLPRVAATPAGPAR